MRQRRQPFKHRNSRMPVVMAVSKLVQIALQILRGNVVVSAMKGTFKLRPERFNSVSMNIAVYIAALGMVYGLVRKTNRGQLLVALKFIGHYGCTALRNLINIFNQRIGLNVGHGFNRNVSAALQDANNSGFLFVLATDISLIRFDCAGELRQLFVHQNTDLVVHAPSRFVGNANLPHQLHSGNAVTAGGHEEHGMKPKAQRGGGLVEHGVGRGANVGFATGTNHRLALGNRIKLSGFTAMVALATLGKLLLKQVLQAGGIIGEIGVELAYRVIFVFKVHTTTIPKG